MDKYNAKKWTNTISQKKWTNTQMTEKCSLSLCSTASAHKQMTPWLPVESLGAGGRENAPIEHLKTRCKMPLLENLCLLRSTFTLAPPSNDTVGAAPAFWIRRGQLAEESEEKGSDCQLTLVILGVRRRRRRRRRRGGGVVAK